VTADPDETSLGNDRALAICYISDDESRRFGRELCSGRVFAISLASTYRSY
jgi:hypothetical protein